MTLSELIILLSNRISWLNSAKSTAIAAGDAAAVLRLDGEIEETQETLNKIQLVV
jgi:hypothetical protein